MSPARRSAWSLGMAPMIPKRVLFFLLWNLVNRAFVRQHEHEPVVPWEDSASSDFSRKTAWRWPRKATVEPSR